MRRVQFLGKLNEFDVGFCALFDDDIGFPDVEMFGKEFKQGGISFAIVGFGAEINGVSIVGIFGDFL